MYIIAIPLHYRFFDIALSILEIKGLDAKALRAFRVLRPLRFLSGIPSKSIPYDLRKHLQINYIFCFLKITYKFSFQKRSPNRFERDPHGNDTTFSYCTSRTFCYHHLRNYWIGDVPRHSSYSMFP